jgi:MSHA biogenesis protein MshO
MMNRSQIQGFTLVEMIVVIVVTGIIGGIVAVFLRWPVQGYVDSARRAEMTDIADTALRRIQRDLRLALPNSVRVTVSGGSTYLEFIPTSSGGRYRDSVDNLGGGNVLNFGAPVTTFDVLGAPPPAPNPGTDFIVVNNTTTDQADLISNAYVGGNRSAYTGRAGNTITIASKTFSVPLNSCVAEGGYVVGGCRFQVVQFPVTYVCTPVAGGAGGTLTRWAEGAFAAVQPTAVPVGVPILANNVSACTFAYASGISQRTGLVTMHLTITEQGESVNLYAATHVSNVP